MIWAIRVTRAKGTSRAKVAGRDCGQVELFVRASCKLNLGGPNVYLSCESYDPQAPCAGIGI